MPSILLVDGEEDTREPISVNRLRQESCRLLEAACDGEAGEAGDAAPEGTAPHR